MNLAFTFIINHPLLVLICGIAIFLSVFIYIKIGRKNNFKNVNYQKDNIVTIPLFSKRVFGYVDDVETIFRMSLVCKDWLTLSRDETIWKRLYALRWLSLDVDVSNFPTWREAFKQQSIKERAVYNEFFSPKNIQKLSNQKNTSWISKNSTDILNDLIWGVYVLSKAEESNTKWFIESSTSSNTEIREQMLTKQGYKALLYILSVYHHRVPEIDLKHDQEALQLFNIYDFLELYNNVLTEANMTTLISLIGRICGHNIEFKEEYTEEYHTCLCIKDQSIAMHNLIKFGSTKLLFMMNELESPVHREETEKHSQHSADHSVQLLSPAPAPAPPPITLTLPEPVSDQPKPEPEVIPLLTYPTHSTSSSENDPENSHTTNSPKNSPKISPRESKIDTPVITKSNSYEKLPTPLGETVTNPRRSIDNLKQPYKGDKEEDETHNRRRKRTLHELPVTKNPNLDVPPQIPLSNSVSLRDFRSKAAREQIFQKFLKHQHHHHQHHFHHQKPDKNFWVDDERVSFCMSCSEPFSVFKRKHHCRLCGKVYCSKCCQKIMSETLINLGYRSPQLACKSCIPHAEPLYLSAENDASHATSSESEEDKSHYDQDQDQDQSKRRSFWKDLKNKSKRTWKRNSSN